MNFIGKNLFIAGRSGSGKSYNVKNEILPTLIKKDKRQIIIIDLKGEYKKGLIIPLREITSIVQIDKICNGKYTKGKIYKIIVFRALDYVSSQIELIFEYLCKCINKILIFEEASFYFEDFKSGSKLPYWTKKFIRTATLPHNNNHNIILITQSPNDIPKIFLGQFNMGKIYKLNPFQLKYLYQSEFLPNQPDFYNFDELYKCYEVEL